MSAIKFVGKDIATDTAQAISVLQDDDGNYVLRVVDAAPFAYDETADIIKVGASNTEGVLLLANERTEETSSDDQLNYSSRGVMIIIRVTSAGTGTMTPKIEVPNQEVYRTILSDTGGITGNGARIIMMYPGIGAAADGVHVTRSYPLPRTWRLTVSKSDASTWIYQAEYKYLI